MCSSDLVAGELANLIDIGFPRRNLHGFEFQIHAQFLDRLLEGIDRVSAPRIGALAPIALRGRTPDAPVPAPAGPRLG